MFLLDSKRKEVLLYMFLVIISICTFGLVFGFRILNPQYDDWLLVGGDLSQHYIGWEAFRSTPWSFPIGCTNALTYPTSVSVIFTDCIPLFAVFFKTLSPILPNTFQYFGMFSLLGYILIGLTASFIIKKYSRNMIYILLGSEFFILSPYILQRYFDHDALGGGQWLILLAFIALIYYEEYFFDMKKGAILWAFIGFVSVAIHMYISVMALMVLIGFCLYDWLKQKKIIRLVIYVAAFFITFVTNIFLLGGVGQGTEVGPGFGKYSANLNSLINPLNFSSIFKGFPSGEGQYEGFGYLGLGIIVLGMIVLGLAIFRRIQLNHMNRDKFISFAIITVVAFMYAVSTEVMLGDRLLFSIPLPGRVVNLLSIFRSSGRFIWVVAYIIDLSLIILLAKSKLRRNMQLILCSVLAICLCVQIYDFSDLIRFRHKQSTTLVENNNSFCNDENLESIVEHHTIKHLFIVEWESANLGYEIAQYAVTHEMTVNRYATVHAVGRDDEDISLKEQLQECPDDTIFLFGGSDEKLCSQYGLTVYRLNNGYIVGYKENEHK